MPTTQAAYHTYTLKLTVKNGPHPLPTLLLRFVDSLHFSGTEWLPFTNPSNSAPTISGDCNPLPTQIGHFVSDNLGENWDFGPLLPHQVCHITALLAPGFSSNGYTRTLDVTAYSNAAMNPYDELPYEESRIPNATLRLGALVKDSF